MEHEKITDYFISKYLPIIIIFFLNSNISKSYFETNYPNLSIKYLIVGIKKMERKMN